MSSEIEQGLSKVVLPMDQGQFSQFITSLLGKPQKISQSYYFPFEITSDDIRDTFLLVEQRVHDQNQAELIQFIVKVSYEDGFSVTHSSLDDFLHYKEIKKLIPVGVNLSWTYLIKFHNRDAPEKQEIELYFSTNNDIDLRRRLSLNKAGKIHFEINHTSRSWGTDIESILSNHIKLYAKKEGDLRVWLRLHSNRISVGFFFSIIFLGLSGLLVTTYILTENERIGVETLLDVEVSTTIEDKIDFLINHSLLGKWPRYFFSCFLFLVILLFGTTFAMIKIEEMSANRLPSFIVTSKNAEKYKNDQLSYLEKSWKNSFIFLVGGITTGVIANVIFTLIWAP